MSESEKHNRRKQLFDPEELKGAEVDRARWPVLFQHLLDNQPRVLLDNGREEVSTYMLALEGEDNSDAFVLILDEAPKPFIGYALNHGGRLRVDAHEYEGGLHERVAFVAEILGDTTWGEHDAHRVKLLAPVKRVSSLMIRVPPHRETLHMEVPLLGAPPEVLLHESTPDRIGPRFRGRMVPPSTQYIREKRIQFASLNVSDLHTRDDDEKPVAGGGEPPSGSGNETEELPMVDAAEPDHEKEQEQEQEKGRERVALLVHPRDDVRARIRHVLRELGWEVAACDEYDEIDKEDLSAAWLLVLPVQLEDVHAVDWMQERIADGSMERGPFVLVGESLATARESEWSGLGEGLFVREHMPAHWLKNKLTRWMRDGFAEENNGIGEGAAPQVLIADDDQGVRESLKEALRRENYRVLVAQDGAEALRRVMNMRPDLVLLDIDMPEPSGLEVLRTIRNTRSTKNTPVIMLTGDRKKDTVREALQLGVSDYILKPFDETSLVQRVDAVFEL